MKVCPSLFVVRHGESENNVDRIECTRLENKHLFGLTEHGAWMVRQQAAELDEFDVILSSPMRRTAETAQIYSDYLSAPVVMEPLLMEIDVGVFELRPEAEADAWRIAQGEAFDSMRFPNGEGPDDVRRRVRELFGVLESRFDGQRKLIVTHGSFIKFMTEVLFEGFSEPDWHRYLEFSGMGRRVVRVADIPDVSRAGVGPG